MGIKSKLRTLAIGAWALAAGLGAFQGSRTLAKNVVLPFAEQQISERWISYGSDAALAEYPEPEEGKLERDLVDFIKGIEEEFKNIGPVNDVSQNLNAQQKKISAELKKTIIRAYATDSKAQLPLSPEEFELTLNRYVDIVFGSALKGADHVVERRVLNVNGLTNLDKRDVFLRTEMDGRQFSAEKIAEIAVHEIIGHIVMGYGEGLNELYTLENMGSSSSRENSIGNWIYNPVFEKTLLDQSSPEEFWKNTMSNEQYAKLWDSKFGDVLSHKELEKIKAVNRLALYDSTSEQAQEFIDFMNIEKGYEYEQLYFSRLSDCFQNVVAPNRQLLKQYQNEDRVTFREFVDSVNTFIQAQHEKGKTITPEQSVYDSGKEAAEKSKRREIYASFVENVKSNLTNIYEQGKSYLSQLVAEPETEQISKQNEPAEPQKELPEVSAQKTTTQLFREAAEKNRQAENFARKTERIFRDLERNNTGAEQVSLTDYFNTLDADTRETLTDIQNQGIFYLYQLDSKTLESLSPDVIRAMKDVENILEGIPIKAELTTTQKILSEVLAEKLMPQLVAENNQRITRENAFLNAWNEHTTQQQGRSV